MAKLQRKNVKIFASNPNHQTQVTTFLTAVDPTPDYSSDPNAIQNEYYPKGWLAKGNDDLPQGEDLNGVLFAESYKNAYLYQMGIAEWNATDEYCENSFCQVNGVLYKSLINSNTNNNPTTDDGTKWEEIPLEPYTGENIGTAEGVYAGKTLNNELQFKTIAVTGNGNITSSGDTITIAIGGGETGDVYWGAIDGTLSNQSDLQQALNQKQNLIGYTPEDQANKTDTIRAITVADDTNYPTELATRTAIESAITTANTYTDTALQGLNSDAFVLYANSWTDVDTGTLTTTAPTGTGTAVQLTSIGSSYENIGNFNYITTQETTFNNTFTYDILIPIRGADLKEWTFKIKLTIEHQDVNGGVPTTLINYETSKFYPPSNQNLNIEIKQDNLNLSSVTYPIGAEIKFNIQAKCEANSYDLNLLIYDQDAPLTISRNRSVNKNLVTAFNTQVNGTLQNQEYFNYTIKSGKQNKIQGVDFYYDSSILKQEPDTNRTSYMGSSFHPYSYGYINEIKTENITRDSADSNISIPSNGGDLIINNGTSGTYGTNYGDIKLTSGGTTKLKITNDTIENSVNITPNANNTLDVGSSSKKLKNVYTTTLYGDTVYTSSLSGNGTPVNSASIKDLSITRYLTLDGGATLATDLIPSSNTINLGDTNNKFQMAFVGTTYTNSLNKPSAGGINIYSDLVPTSGQYLGSSSKAYGKTYTDEINVATIVGTATSPNTGSIIAKGRLYIYNGSTEVLQFGFSQALPSTHKGYNLGGSNNSFNGIYGASFVNTSDIRLKENIEEYEINALDKINNLTPITYNFKDEDKENIKLGLSAQEVKEQEPLCVNGSESDEDFLGIDIYALNTLCIKAIKELKEKVDFLELRVEELEKGNKKELEK